MFLKERHNQINSLLTWYNEYKRDLPWRHTSDPYRIWISEIMLQQTRAEAVREYYIRFLDAVPDIFALAKIPDDRLMKLWEGLGYDSRARNLKKAAQTVVQDFDGVLPSSPVELLRLPGIGSYTAGAISSIAFRVPVPAVDGNVLRVAARLNADKRNILIPNVKKDVENELFEVMSDPLFPKEQSGDFNQALIELGATLCGPDRAPGCADCPLSRYCRAHLENLTSELPVRKKDIRRKIEKLTILLIRDGDDTAIRLRASEGLLGGMYEFPNMKGHASEEEALAFVRERGYDTLHIRKLRQSRHLFSHIEWKMQGYEIRIAGRSGDEPHHFDDWIFASPSSILEDYALPSAFSAYEEYLKEKYL